MLLASVLFLTRVWHDDILTAGLQIAPGPVAAAVFAIVGGVLTGRFGQRAIAVAGGLLFAAGGLWWLTQVGIHPQYASEFLPGMLIGGAGVGLVIPTLASAAAAALPPARFATGSAVYGMSRQFGIALGVAILIGVLGSPDSAHVLAAFRNGWTVMLVGAIATALAAMTIGRIPREPARSMVAQEIELPA
jgi:MFS family permease